MITLKLKDLENSIKENNSKREHIIKKFEEKTKQSSTVKGRVRPKHPTESKILSMFSKKEDDSNVD
ncbi:hypothetical protein P9E76_15515 [Schinkia azotoformans]|uniref:Uncharacterized protein n=1 Tax=Schinkia azotoformans LMG 9581 TaxID=1131731 RepID=K6D6F2_SCHAZ|nr:hypothetical protein [Schinkia azotoformans]EKN68082.1 hypothetical protein BAZO_06179 [Schinkia azotoformans LMG 9581]MEC1638113.1 hypothetical protein [Schinkia azotoformans]MEC1946453.1 hypothetical protein [Schinkia azotoformans]